MLKPVFEDLLRRTKIDPKLIDDITVGNVLQIGSGEF
jgi:hypothetical protein